MHPPLPEKVTAPPSMPWRACRQPLGQSMAASASICTPDRAGDSPVAPILRRTLCLLAATIALLGLINASASVAAPLVPRAQTCGLLPGEGAYSYVRVWNVGCAKANKVAKKALARFCDPLEKCFGGAPTASPVKGHAHVHAWRCKLKFAWEFSRIRCEAPHKRFVQASGA